MKIDPYQLPSVPLIWRRKLPFNPGVYFAIDGNNNILYIGKAGGLNQRWVNHHRTKQLRSLGEIRIAYLCVENTDGLSDLESECIKRFQPPLNGSNIIGVNSSRCQPTLYSEKKR